MICADTSFLISFYGDDVKSGLAREHQFTSGRPLHVHALNDFELANALRALVFRRKITPDQRKNWLGDYEEDKMTGILRPTPNRHAKIQWMGLADAIRRHATSDLFFNVHTRSVSTSHPRAPFET